MKRLLTADEAAEYCGLGVQSFHINCTAPPRRVRPGQRGLRWDVRDLDEWIDNLPHEGEENRAKTPDQWLAVFDGGDQDQRSKGVHQQRNVVRISPPERNALLSLYGSPAFLAELEAVEKKYQAEHVVVASKPGTWGDLVRKYKEFYLPTKAPRTQKDYNRILNWLASLDGMPLKDWSRAFAIKLRDKAFKAHGRRFANYVMAVVQGIFSWGLDRGFVAEQPIQKIKVIKRPKSMPRANRPWSREEWDAVVSAAPAHLRAPILLCGVLGWREGEAITRPRDDYDRAAKKIKRISSKSGKLVKTPVPKLIGPGPHSSRPTPHLRHADARTRLRPSDDRRHARAGGARHGRTSTKLDSSPNSSTISMAFRRPETS